jgi:hypothetical protein
LIAKLRMAHTPFTDPACRISEPYWLKMGGTATDGPPPLELT